ncbi:MAG: hypothetical protein Q8O88_02495 [bacterium]|nr:hypothetical protein [bacterium]
MKNSQESRKVPLAGGIIQKFEERLKMLGPLNFDLFFSNYAAVIEAIPAVISLGIDSKVATNLTDSQNVTDMFPSIPSGVIHQIVITRLLFGKINVTPFYSVIVSNYLQDISTQIAHAENEIKTTLIYTIEVLNKHLLESYLIPAIIIPKELTSDACPITFLFPEAKTYGTIENILLINTEMKNLINCYSEMIIELNINRNNRSYFSYKMAMNGV